ncbi:short-chain dehydrogenase/reductase [Nocardia jejuensis]|uniref:short-chain dehydrogenase/reductase n=1 Tax=Nocardia jejuensis TaxID=328049 RepID=UPI000A04FA2C|nr:short-chain dehydrogenase/reductase [Nocardia jejuensis]
MRLFPGIDPTTWFGGGAFAVEGKVVLITGAAQGIGAALARAMHARGAVVVLSDVDEDAVRATASEFGPRTLAVRADVADREEMAQRIAEVVERFGRLDVVIANAGVTPVPATLRSMNPKEFDRVMGINLTGVFNTVHPALDHIVRSKGHVVVVSSCAAFAPGAGGSPYMMSKAAVEQLGRALRVELAAHGASAGVAYFGIVETAMTHEMLDTDDLGRRLDAMLPWPLGVRITAEQAAHSVVDGIARRAPRTIAPAGWIPYSLLRGAINVVLDGKLAADATMHDLIRSIELRR